LRGRRFATEADIERHIANGFGQGAGASYLPWLRVQDVPSRGKSRKIHGIKVDRLHHLFSNLESAYFLVCEFSEDVIDIREQYPLLPVSSAQTIASTIGVKYPKYPRTTLPYVLTTDFLLTVKNPDGSFRLVARTIKYCDDLQGNAAARTLEKLEIEKRFWMAQGVDWAIVTEKYFTPELIQNLGLLRKFAQIPRALSQVTLQKDFLCHLVSCRDYQLTTSKTLRKIASSLFISYQDSRYLFHHVIWTKQIKLDLGAAPLQMISPLPSFVVVADVQQKLMTA
jgi:hypothetical protein